MPQHIIRVSSGGPQPCSPHTFGSPSPILSGGLHSHWSRHSPASKHTRSSAPRQGSGGSYSSSDEHGQASHSITQGAPIAPDLSPPHSSAPAASSLSSVQLPPPCDLGGADPQARWNAISLAYLGDAVWEAYLRTHLYGHQSNTSPLHYNTRVAAKANTHAQARCYQLLLAEGWPSAQEAQLLRWAANSTSVTPPKHASRQQYKQATALEALVAYLYLKDVRRLQQLMDWLLEPGRVPKWRSEETAGQLQRQAAGPAVQGARQQRRRHIKG